MSANAHLTRRRSPWTWLPTLYVAEALPYVLVNTLTVYLYTKMGIGKAEMTFYTGWLYLPWVIKPFWSPFVDILSTKRAWTLAMQVLMGVCFAAIAFLIPTSFFFAATLAFFWLAAFFSATHDIAADGYYMLELSDHDQAAYVGVRSTFYRLGSLLASGGLVWIAGLIELHGLPVGTEHVPHERVVVAWSTIFFIAGALLLIISLYHWRFMPKAPKDAPRAEHDFRQIIHNFGSTFATFFAKRGIITAICFMLLFRLPEAICLKLVGPFLLDSRELGGLAMTTAEVGLANGIVGVIGILLGGILGGIAISRQGLKFWLWPMALSLTLPCVFYFLLALFLPQTNLIGLTLINVAIFVEQFGYGFGFTAFMLYLIYFSEGPWKTAHYAFCTAFMALGMMLPGMAAGWIYEQLDPVGLFGPTHQGYVNFFLLVIISSAFTFLACMLVKIDPNFGKKNAVQTKQGNAPDHPADRPLLSE